MAASEGRFIVRYWGVRGSIPTPGPTTVRYGGNTTCIEVRCDDEILIIDTGTGARSLGNQLIAEAKGAPLKLTVAYSHHHLDHVQGFPFFLPIYQSSTRLQIISAGPKAGITRSVLSSQMTYPSFPVGLESLSCELNYQTVDPGATFEVGDISVETCPLHHPGGALAFRVNHRGHAFCQASDVEHTSEVPDPALVALCKDADYLSYDSTYTAGEEYERFKGWGHSTWRHGLGIAEAAGVKRFIAFHHDPSHDDDFMDGVAADMAAVSPSSLVAREGLTLDLLAGEVSFAGDGTHG